MPNRYAPDDESVGGNKRSHAGWNKRIKEGTVGKARNGTKVDEGVDLDGFMQDRGVWEDDGDEDDRDPVSKTDADDPLEDAPEWAKWLSREVRRIAHGG